MVFWGRILREIVCGRGGNIQRFRNADPLPDPELPPVWASMSHSLEMGLRGDQGKIRHVQESVKISKK